jgi:type III secretion protein U
MSEKKHKPTRKRLKDAKKRGEIARSREFTSFGAFVATCVFLWLGASIVMEHVIEIAERAIQAPQKSAGDAPVQWLPDMQQMAVDMFWALLPLCAMGAAAAILVGALQSRGTFSLTPMVPRFERVSPGHGIKNLFSTRQLFELGKMILKTMLLLAVLFYVIVTSLDPLARMVYAPAADLLRVAGEMTLRMMVYAGVIYAISAAIDYVHQRYEFMKSQRMSVEEMRREYRENEGHPQIRANRRAIAREAAFAKVATRVTAASVVVVNPTHVSVALYYVSGETALPRVIAKGVDALALRIRTEAARAGVPILEDAPLARRLFREVALDSYIGEDMIDVIAAAFRWARQVDRRPTQPQSGSRSPRQNPTPRTV